MLDVLTKTLTRLRQSLTGKAEQAYKDRDAPGATSTEQHFAAGEGHAYGVAADEVHEAEEEEKDS